MTTSDRWRLERAEAEIEKLRAERDEALKWKGEYLGLRERVRAALGDEDDEDDDW